MRYQTIVKAFRILLISFLLLFVIILPSYSQEEVPELKIGVVGFLSGSAAGTYGIPARNSVEVFVEAINNGNLPAPYDTVGIAGAKVMPIFIDENSTNKVVDYRNLIEKQGADIVIGYTSSGSCKAIAPVVEEVEVLTIFFECGTPQIFEEIVTKPKYLFRTSSHATMDSVAAAKYVLARTPAINTIAGINQNYAWGQDSWRDFSESIKTLSEGTEVTTEQFPQIFSGQYGTEISVLLKSHPDIIHSSFWGGDLEAFILQGASRGLFDRSQLLFTTGETSIFRLADQLPDGTIIGARGSHGAFAPENELNTWFRNAYYERYGTQPLYPSYHMVQSILGVKSAYDKAAADSGEFPDIEAVINAFEYLEYETPSGTTKMTLANGHQGIQGTAYGKYKYDGESGTATLEDIEYYSADCVNPPANVNSLDWISSNFDGAECGTEGEIEKDSALEGNEGIESELKLKDEEATKEEVKEEGELEDESSSEQELISGEESELEKGVETEEVESKENIENESDSKNKEKIEE